MMFSGQGTQYVGMGGGLYRSYRVYREAVDVCSEIAERELGVSIREVMYGEGGAEGRRPRGWRRRM